jgi:hypothetical protein
LKEVQEDVKTEKSTDTRSSVGQNPFVPASEGAQVEFSWLGQPKKGSVVKIEKDRIKIKTPDGMTYPVKPSDVKSMPESVRVPSD